MKRIFYILVILGVFFSSACVKEDEKNELIVFAASSLTDSLLEIAEAYEKESTDTEIIFNFDSSGTLKAQIEEGADCDIFISASEKMVKELEEGAILYSDTVKYILSNKCVLIVPEGNPSGIKGFDDIINDDFKLIALGNSDVPAGQYAKEIFTYLGIWERINADKKITFGANVREVLSYVEEGASDCGIVYSTDANISLGKVEIIEEAPKDSHSPVIYPMAVVLTSENIELAEDFLSFLEEDKAKSIFENAGFGIK